MNLVNEQNRPLAESLILLRALDDGFDVFDTSRHRGELLETRLGLPRDDARERRFARSRRTPEDHGRDMIRRDDAVQYFSLRHEMPLSDKLGKCLRPHPIGKRGAIGSHESIMPLSRKKRKTAKKQRGCFQWGARVLLHNAHLFVYFFPDNRIIGDDAMRECIFC